MDIERFLVNLVGSTIAFLLFTLIVAIRLILLRRAVFKVIGILRERHSLCYNTAKTLDELGLTPPDFLKRLSRPKDYKPYALQALIRLGIVRVTDDGRICLSEETLRDIMPPEFEERNIPKSAFR
jgi:hypothetical protein